MIAPEYFNNHVSVEGEIIVKSVPNDAGFVLVWNPTTKKISRRTHAEIATDLGLVTASNEAFFNRNRIRSETISSVPVSLDAYLPQGGFISSYNTSSWGGSDRPINASYGGYIKFSDGNNDFNNLELYYNNGHNTPDTHRLWFRTKNNLGSTNWFEAYHSGNLNPGDYWEKLTTGFRGINDNDSRNFSFLSDNGSIAKKINTGGLLVSDIYSNETYVPANGIWSKGNIQSNSRVVSSREGFFGAYDYTQTQGVWSIGESFNVNSNGSTTDLGNQYGMAYSYIDVGGSSFANVHQIHFASAGVAQVSIDCNYGRIRGREYQVIGGNSNQFLKADGSLDSASYVTSAQLSDYVTINTPQEIETRKVFRPGIGNRYDEATLELRGSNASSVYPTISFHQPGLYAGTISLRNLDQFSFRNTDDSDFNYLLAKGYIISGLNDNYLLLAGGGYKAISDFATTADLSNYVNRSGDTMTGQLNALTISAQNASDKLIYDNIENYGSSLKINANGNLGIILQANTNNILYVGADYVETYKDLYVSNGSMIYTTNHGNSAHWIQAYNWGNHSEAGYVTINTPQTIIADKTFAPTASLTFSGNDVNSIKSFAESNGNIGIVAGWVYRHYSTFWKTGNKRGGNTDSLGYAFDFSSDDVTYNQKVLIQPDSNIVTSDFGSADQWNAKVSQSQLINYVTKTVIINNNFDSVTEGGFYRANSQGAGVEHLYSPMLHLPGTDTSAQLQIRHNDGGSGAGELIYRGGYNGTWGSWRRAWDNVNLPQTYVDYLAYLHAQGAVIQSQLGNYLPLSGGTLTEGGRIDARGNITIQQTDVSGNATGIWWDDIADTDRIAGIGTLTDNGNLNYLYMGWGNTPWDQTKSFTVNDSFIRYKGNDIWHAGNFNPNTKANALENAKGIGFSSGNYPTANGIEYPYLYFDNGSTTSYVALATQEFTNANYHKINNGFGLNNESDSNYNKSWFDYSWAGSGSPGSVINFSGLGGYYATELFGEYGNGGNRFGLRTRNGDAAQWNDPRWIWHSGNFNPSQYVTQSSINSQLANYATLNGVQTFTNTISFSQSPVIPNGTINSHAVNLGQLYYNDRNFITDSRGAIRPPSFYDDRFAQWDFQYTDDTQVTGDAWQGVLTVAKWSNFDPSHRQEQILFTGENLKRRTAIDDDTWGPEKTIWDSGNFTPANFATASQLNDKVNRSGDTMTGALLIGNTNIGKQRVLHLAEPTLLDSYGFNFYTDTSTGLLTLHGLNNGSSNAVPILSAKRGNNFVGINKENPASELDVNGYVASNGFIKNNSSDDYFLMGGGGQLTKYSKDDAFVNSHRDFPDGTLITTSIDYSQSQGDSFLLEIKGNMYGGGIPMDTKVQGYIYADTIINQSGYSTYSDLNTIVAMNINGNLCFWFPRLWYWQGFSVKVMATGGGDLTTINRVISIDNSPEPAGTKHVKIAIYTLSTQSWVNNQGFLTSANLNGYVTQSSLNTQLGNYATLNGVQTFNNTNTFNQSPVIPNGTLGNHAVNLNQLLDVAPPYHWNYVGQPAITNRRVLREMTWNNYGNGHTIFDISSGTTPWGASKSNVDAEQPWTPSYPTLVGGNGTETYGVRVDSARNSDNLGGISAGNYATQTWVNTNYIPRSHPVFNITQANINSWNAVTGGGSSHNHSNLSYLNNIDQYLGTGQGPQFGSIRLMDSLGYGLLALEEDFIGGEIGLVDLSNDRFYAGRINEYLKYGSSVNDFEGLNIHFDAKLLCIGREIGNDEDKVQLAGDLSVDTIDIYHNSRQLILNPLYNTNGDVRHSRNAHIYIVTGNTVSLPDKPILGQRIEIFNDSDSYIEVTHGNVGTMFKIPGFCKVTGIVANKGFRFDAEPIRTRQYDI
ncbi:hypothetical protein D3C71_17860 [compost metagenome]